MGLGTAMTYMWHKFKAWFSQLGMEELEDCDRLYYLHMEKGLSEYDLFQEAWLEYWGRACQNIEPWFSSYILKDEVPYFVRQYIRKHWKGV